MSTMAVVGATHAVLLLVFVLFCVFSARRVP